MGGFVIDATARSAAPPERVFDLLADGRTWVDWGVWTRFEIEQPGAPEPEGPGAIRVLTSRAMGRTVVSRERVLELTRPSRLRYGLLSGLPLRGYVGQVDLVPAGDGTLIRWHSEFDGAPLGSGWFYRAVLRRFIADAAQRLARHAERPVAA